MRSNSLLSTGGAQTTLFDVRFELNASLKDYQIGASKDNVDELITIGETEATAPRAAGRGPSRFKRHLERVIEQKEILAEAENGENDVDFDKRSLGSAHGSFVESDEYDKSSNSD